MIDAEAFGVGLAKLAAAVRQPLDDLTLEVYHEQLAGEGDTAEWVAYVGHCLKHGVWADWVPKLDELRTAFMRWRVSEGPARYALPADTRTVEEKRADFRAGHAAFLAELERRGLRMNTAVKGMEG